MITQTIEIKAFDQASFRHAFLGYYIRSYISTHESSLGQREISSKQCPLRKNIKIIINNNKVQFNLLIAKLV